MLGGSFTGDLTVNHHLRERLGQAPAATGDRFCRERLPMRLRRIGATTTPATLEGRCRTSSCWGPRSRCLADRRARSGRRPRRAYARTGRRFGDFIRRVTSIHSADIAIPRVRHAAGTGGRGRSDRNSDELRRWVVAKQRETEWRRTMGRRRPWRSRHGGGPGRCLDSSTTTVGNGMLARTTTTAALSLWHSRHHVSLKSPVA